MTTPAYDIESLRPWIEWRFSRSSGPGGQNVNKVSTRVTLLLDIEACAALSDSQKARIRSRLGSRVSRDSVLRVVVQTARSQLMNRATAEKRLIELLTEATRRQTARRPTKPTAGSRMRRLDEKRKRAEIKRHRGSPTNE